MSICGADNFHPWECDHNEYCVHCTNGVTDWHNPKWCWLCCDGDPAEKKPIKFVGKPYARRIRFWVAGDRKRKVKITKGTATLSPQLQLRLAEAHDVQ